MLLFNLMVENVTNYRMPNTMSTSIIVSPRLIIERNATERKIHISQLERGKKTVDHAKLMDRLKTINTRTRMRSNRGSSLRG